MDAEIFRDLKQLDERLHTVGNLLDSCAYLFSKNYRAKLDDKDTFSWPYAIKAIKGKEPELTWPKEYEGAFPDTPKLSPSTAALCGWAVGRLSGPDSDIQKSLGEFAAQAAENLAQLPPGRLKSKTFELVGEIFLHAQVLRFLASQAQYKGDLFSEVFTNVRETIDKPDRPEPDKWLHPFMLHYCVLAWEQIRGPVTSMTESVLKICNIADDTVKLKADATGQQDVLKHLMKALNLGSDLRDALESFATVVDQTLRQSEIRDRLDVLAADTEKDVVAETASRITQGSQDDFSKILASLSDILDRSISESAGVLSALPTQITELQTAPESAPATLADLKATVATIKKYQWYSEAFLERLGREVVWQVSFASSSEESRLDIGALAYSLSAIVNIEPSYLPKRLARKALSIIFEHQRGGRWNEIQPMARTAIGFVHFPLNIEIANAVLSVLLKDSAAEGSITWSQIDEVMDWLTGTVNKVSEFSGWSSEHDYSHDRIDLWATAQVAQFLLDYREIRNRLVIRSAIDRAGLVTTPPDMVETTWKKLGATDLEQDDDKQIKIKLKDQFVTPFERRNPARSSSVLLYGPPGTSKTTLVGALANRLQWHFLQIAPADFLLAGGEQVEARATLLFEILKRARNLVVLFDEVDEFLLDREDPKRPEGIFRFMTTSMLPKLQSLKSQKSLIFAIATNYKERLDRAITRAGRVDHDWEVLPPDFTSRIVLIGIFGKGIPHDKLRMLAGNMPFFSVPEIKRAVSRKPETVSDLWNAVPHPTASPEVYTGRPRLAEEFPSLLAAQITGSLIPLIEADIKSKLKGQLEEFHEIWSNKDKLPEDLKTKTMKSVGEAIKRLS